MTETINVPVSSETAEYYRNATPQERGVLDHFLQVRIELASRMSPRTIFDVMDEMGQMAEENGLTQEIYDEIFKEWDDERRR